MYWGWGFHIVPSVGSLLGQGSGGSAQGSSHPLFLHSEYLAGMSSIRKCQFWSFGSSRATGSPGTWPACRGHTGGHAWVRGWHLAAVHPPGSGSGVRVPYVPIGLVGVSV